MNPDYHTVYQVSNDPAYSSSAHSIVIVAVILVIVPIALGLIIFWARWKFRWRRVHWLVPACLCAVGLLSLYIGGPRNLHQDSDALSAYERGDYQTVEGRVIDFDPMPYEGHKKECFSVQDKRFCYSDYILDPGFRNTASHGGPIHPGLQVRIAYKPVSRRNMILRIDIFGNQPVPQN